MNWKLASAVLVLLLTATVGALVYLAANPGGDLETQPPPAAADPSTTPAIATQPATSPNPLATTPETPAAAENPVSEAPPTPADQRDWNERIGEALTGENYASMRQRSQALLKMAGDPNGTTEQRIDALEHGLNLLEDENYWDDVLPLGLRKDLPAEINETIFAELHGRDTKLLTAFCQEIGKIEGHPLAEDAKGVLDFISPPEVVDN